MTFPQTTCVCSIETSNHLKTFCSDSRRGECQRSQSTQFLIKLKFEKPSLCANKCKQNLERVAVADVGSLDAFFIFFPVSVFLLNVKASFCEPLWAEIPDLFVLLLLNCEGFLVLVAVVSGRSLQAITQSMCLIWFIHRSSLFAILRKISSSCFLVFFPPLSVSRSLQKYLSGRRDSCGLWANFRWVMVYICFGIFIWCCLIWEEQWTFQLRRNHEGNYRSFWIPSLFLHCTDSNPLSFYW